MRIYSPHDRYGRLTPIAIFEQGGKPYVRLLCLCDCGTLKPFYKSNLTNGYVKSCGCLQRELASKRSSTHRASRKTSPLYSTYRAWTAMRLRCRSITDKQYSDYGGRGITVCDRWKNSFENFLSDMGPRPSGRHGGTAAFTIDRKNNAGNYEPSNCRWATWIEQNNNRRPAKANRWTIHKEKE